MRRGPVVRIGPHRKAIRCGNVQTVNGRRRLTAIGRRHTMKAGGGDATGDAADVARPGIGETAAVNVRRKKGVLG